MEPLKEYGCCGSDNLFLWPEVVSGSGVVLSAHSREFYLLSEQAVIYHSFILNPVSTVLCRNMMVKNATTIWPTATGTGLVYRCSEVPQWKTSFRCT